MSQSEIVVVSEQKS